LRERCIAVIDAFSSNVVHPKECGRIRADDGETMKVGDRVVVLPNHACEIPNLAEAVFFRRDERIEGVWFPVARGKVW
jgi:D-serine deaminase-like pyridoxal phosphate-dependent protein